MASNSPIAKAADALKNAGSARAGAALVAAFTNRQLDWTDFEQIRGAVEATLVLANIHPGTPEAVAQSLSDIAVAYGKRLDEDIKRFDEMKKGFETLRAEVKAETGFMLGEGKKAYDEIGMRTDKSAQEAIASIRATEEAYKTQMGLKAPVDYWKIKAGTHRTAKKRYNNLTWGYAAIVSIATFLLVKNYGSSVVEILSAHDKVSTYVFFASIFAFVTTIIFWIARVVVRLYLSERHLESDAAERAVLVETYLALTEAGKVEATDRALVLGPLFRPSSDGIVKDEGAPETSLAALVSRLLDPKKG